MLMSLGAFVFSIDDLLFDQLRERRVWRHPAGDRVGLGPSYQFAGPGEHSLSLGGLLAPGQIGRRDALDDITSMADAGGALPLIDGEGYIYGAFVITGLDTSRSHFHRNGLALKIDFTIDLVRVDTDGPDLLAAGEG